MDIIPHKHVFCNSHAGRLLDGREWNEVPTLHG